jgi:3-dehydroquinate synthase
MKTLQVELAERSYPIHIGPGLLARADLLAAHLANRRVVVVTNETLAPLYLNKVRALLAPHQPVEIILPDGEQYKTFAVLTRIFDELLKARCDRRSVIVALGGGVVGDMAGFAAACYQRGIAFIQVPTTLLAQVDSSVGGKTGVNHPLGKNMIGAFHQPQAVVIDTDTLNTLPDRELRAGLAEVVKYGLIRDVEFFHWLELNMQRLLGRDAYSLSYAIERSCRNKSEVVAADERENDVRAILNFGHTFGHAIETALGYSGWLHGEAVAAGMVMAADLSRRLGWLAKDDVARIGELLRIAGLPLRAPAGPSAARLRELMTLDKKAENGRLRFVLLQQIGQAVVTAEVPAAMLDETLAAHTAPA